jgi:hypothetical protein
MKSAGVPDGVPILSRGRHRSPRRGASFMEYASFLAGERWSDHPSCTHPLLAQVARQANDLIEDSARQELVSLIPSVVDRRGDEVTWLTLPVAVAAGAIYEAPAQSQHILAAGLLRAAQLCDEAGPELDHVGREIRDALEMVPMATQWAEQFLARVGSRITPRVFAAQCGPTLIRCAVDGIVMSGGPESGVRLRALLVRAIAACPAHVGAP